MRVAFLCLAFCFAGSIVAQDEPRPNVLFLFADDQRPDTIRAWGNEHIDTPNLDALVERGFSFRSNYCMGSIHGAVCQPSRAMVMSGRTLWRVPMQLQGTRTMPEHLGKAGYETFGTGKWHNGQESFARSFQRGRSIMFGGMSDHTKVPIRDMEGRDFTAQRTGEKFSSELFADAAIDFLKSRDRKKPFFCYVAFTAPHDPRQPPEKYRQRYYDDRPPLPANFKPQHPFHNGWMTGRDEGLAAWPRTEADISDQLCEYYGLITHLDEHVGRIVETLKATGDFDNTIIVYAADHGLAVGSHGLLGKQSVYEHAMGCPLIIAGPGVRKGQTRAGTYLYDIFPTVCAMTETVPPQGIEGHDLTQIIDGQVSSHHNTIFLAYEDKMRSIRDRRYKLIRYPRIDHTQLFDLQGDPDEKVNLANERSYRIHVNRLKLQMAEWQQRVGDQLPWTMDKVESKEIDLTGRQRKPDRWQPEWIVKKYFK